LEHHAAVRTGTLDLDAIDRDLALGGLHVAGDGIEQRRLTATRRSKQADEFAGLDLDRGLLDRRMPLRTFAEGDADLVDHHMALVGAHSVARLRRRHGLSDLDDIFQHVLPRYVAMCCARRGITATSRPEVRGTLRART